MKNFKSIIVFSIFAWLFLNFPTVTFAAGNDIQVNDLLDVEEVGFIRVPLTNQPITLFGKDQEKTFHYELIETIPSGENKLVLNVEKSDLLIEPSSITVSVDDEPVLSVPIYDEQKSFQVEVPLAGKALEKGFHAVTISFYGVIQEGICVSQNTSGNWVTIEIDSYYQFANFTNVRSSLEDYPEQFIGTENEQVTIIIPAKASMETINNGMKVASFLAGRSEKKEYVTVERETTVGKLSGKVVIVGALKEFETKTFNDILSQAQLPNDKNTLILSRHKLVEGDHKVEALIVTGDRENEMEERINILLDTRLTKQFTHSQMSIQTVPEMQEQIIDNDVSLKKIGLPDLTFTSRNPESEMFYYYLPAEVLQDERATLSLKLKHSPTIRSIVAKEKDAIDFATEVELITFVNGVPSAIDIRSLEKNDNDAHELHIPIDTKHIKENRLVSIQFRTTGLLADDPCIESDQEKWIYIDAEDSYLSIPLADEISSFTLSSFPFSLIDYNKKSVIVLPEKGDVSDQELFSIYRSLTVPNRTPNIRIIHSDDLTAEDAANNHLLFIGDPSKHHLLNKKKNEFLISYDNDKVNLHEHGFIAELIDRYTWIQQSPWNKDHVFIVFDRLHDKVSYTNQKLFDFLPTINDSSNIAVMLQNEEIYTSGHEEKSPNNQKIVEEKEASDVSIGWIVGFATLFILAIILFIIALRRNRRVSK